MSDEKRIFELEEKIIELEGMNLELLVKIEKMGSGKGRKTEVLEVLRNNGLGISVKKISEELGISCKNVSSQLSYLRGDGYEIWSNGKGDKVLVENNMEKEEV